MLNDFQMYSKNLIEDYIFDKFWMVLLITWESFKIPLTYFIVFYLHMTEYCVFIEKNAMH